MFRLILQFYFRFHPHFLINFVFCFLLSLIEIFPLVAIAYLVQYIFDQAIASKDVAKIIWGGAGLIGLTALMMTLASFQNLLSLKVTDQAVYRLREKLIEKCHELPSYFYTKENYKRCHISIVRDSERIEYMGIVFLTQFFPSLVLTGALTFILLFLNSTLFIFLFISFPFLAYISLHLKKRLNHHTYNYQRSFESFSQGVLFNLEMMDLIHTQSAEKKEKLKQMSSINLLQNHSKNLITSRFLYSLGQNATVAFAASVILIVGGAFVATGSLLLGQLLSFYFVLGLMKRYLQEIASSVPHLIEGKEAFCSLKNFLDTSILTPYQGKKRIEFKGEISLKNVCFSYEETPLLSQINFTIKPGEWVTLRGSNGSGKSTLANLILGFYRPQQGQILIDGHPLETLHLPSLRHSIGVVRQNPLFFSGTIAENLTYGLKNLSSSALEQILQELNLMPFIQDLPLKMETAIGNHGLHLSGGQRQSLALARALIRHPKLLILDEPTNHLDSPTFFTLIQRLKEWKKNMSILLITHHPLADSLTSKTFFLKKGKLVTSYEK